MKIVADYAYGYGFVSIPDNNRSDCKYKKNTDKFGLGGLLGALENTQYNLYKPAG